MTGGVSRGPGGAPVGSSATGSCAPQFGQKRAPSGTGWLHDGQVTIVPLRVGGALGRASVCPALGARCGNRHLRMEATIWATSVGFLPTSTPTSWKASDLACAVPLDPVMIAPACPMRLPGGAVNPAT